MLKLTIEQHRKITFWGLVFIAAGLPLSVFLVSVGQFILAANWLLEGNYKKRLIRFFTDPLSLITISIFFLFVLGMIHTDNIDQGLRELRIKLPLLTIPFLLFTSHLPKRKQIQNVLFVFITATVLTSIMGCISRYGFEDPNPLNKRSLSVFISHIRFGLMVVFSMFMLGYYLVLKRKEWSITEKLLSLAVIGWLFFFLVLSESASAYIVFVALLGFTLLRALFAARNRIAKFGSMAVMLIGLTASFIYVNSIYQNHIHEIPFDYRTLDVFTVNGKYYGHQKDVLFRENGHRVWNYVCLDELKNEWPKRSDVLFEALDRSGQQVRFTLIRYLTSKGLRKDSVGLHALSDEDIGHIESGFTNYKYIDPWGVSRRIDQFLWEVESYHWNGDPNTSSFILRLTYLKIGLEIIKENPLFGVGTGDLRDSYGRKYEQNDEGLIEFRKSVSHNQFLTVAIGVGVIGLLWFTIAFFYPIRFYWRDYLHTGLILLIAVSFLSDNTLDSQSGVTLFAFFNALLMVRKEWEPIQTPTS